MRVREIQNDGNVPEDKDSSSSSSSGTYYQGTLNCSWDDGFPHYVFAIDDNRKAFITSNLLKVEPFSNKGVDYIYKFHLGAKEPNLLGEMSVVTSIELCPHGTQIMETEFVLCANGENIEGYSNTSDHTREMNKGLSKVVSFFKDHSYKQRFSAMQENWGHLSSPKLELAAIVVKDHIRESQKDVEIGGWGLKFLKKDRHCEFCKQNTGMNVLVPAGFHGRPKIRKGGGPSSLVERWRSGGSCDCGGWDLGCPLTVLYARPNHQHDVFRESDTFDLFVEGCKQSVPVLKLVEVRDGLYDIHYKSILSPVQSLSIALAAVHSRSPILRPIPYSN